MQKAKEKKKPRTREPAEKVGLFNFRCHSMTNEYKTFDQNRNEPNHQMKGHLVHISSWKYSRIEKPQFLHEKKRLNQNHPS